MTDPFTNDFGIKAPRAMQAGLLVQSHQKGYADNDDVAQPAEGKKVFSITHAGEYEASGVFVNGIFAPTKSYPEHTMYRILLDDVAVGFLGALDRKLTDAEIEALGDIHVLIVPVGGDDVLSPDTAADVVSQVEPRVVIPAYCHTDGLKTKHGTVESFIKSLGVTPSRESKYKVTKSSLPADDMALVILEA